jgi:hypothetical protein
MTYYAISDVNGPCSRELAAMTDAEAMIEALGDEQDQAVEYGSTDIEDALDIDLAGRSDWSDALIAAGARHVGDAGGDAVQSSGPMPCAPVGAVEVWQVED